MSRRRSGRPSEADLETRALRLLKVRERSRKELEIRLLRKGHTIDEVSRLLDRFEANGWVDDGRFARLFVADRLKLRPRSYRMLDREMGARGISAPIRQRVLAEARERMPEDELARSMARRRWNRLSGDPESIARWLLSRGFAPSLAKQAAKSVAREKAVSEETGASGESQVSKDR